MIRDSFFPEISGVAIAHKFLSTTEAGCFVDRERKSWGIAFAWSGEAEFRYSGGKIRMKAGSAVLLPRGMAYKFVPISDCLHWTVNFTLAEEQEEMSLPRIVGISDTEGFRRLFDKAANIWTSRQAGYKMRVVGILYEILAEFFAEGERVSLEGRPAFRQVSLAREYIEGNFCGEVSIPILAEVASMSETNLRRAFKSLYGETAMEYRDRLRIERATDLLSTGFYTVGEVAELCGFADLSHFCRFYKGKTGKRAGEV